MVLDGERCEKQQDDDNAERRANGAGHDANSLPWIEACRPGEAREICVFSESGVIRVQRVRTITI
jgi:hypothetical protein